jgi:hypothetical protein
VLYIQQLRGYLKTDSADIRTLRLSAVGAAAAWFLSLMVTPIHFASALLPLACVALAIAPLRVRNLKHAPLTKLSRGIWIAATVLGFGLVITFSVIAYGQLLAEPGRYSSFERNYLDLQEASRIIPHDPLMQRRLIGAQIFVAQTEQELTEALAVLERSPSYITGYGPNLVEFAQLILDKQETLQLTGGIQTADALLRQARILMPETPALLGEELHLAFVLENVADIQKATQAFEPKKELYPPGEGYLIRSAKAVDAASP